jgi:protein TonB
MKSLGKTLVVAMAAIALAMCAGAANGQQSAPKKAVRISGGVMAGLILTKVQPAYPADAKAAGVSGAVVLHVIIGKDGTVENLQVISGPEMLQKSAIEAVTQWTYKPYLLNGEPVQVDTTVTVMFTLAP